MPTRKLRSITAEDLYQLETLSDVRLSPGGNKVLYCLHRVDKETEKKFSNICVVDVEEGQPFQFTFGDQTDNHPRWSPDGNTIAFLSTRSNQVRSPQIFLIPINGGEARQLTNIDGTIETFEWSPNGKEILCKIRKKDKELAERQKIDEKKPLGIISRHYHRIFYKFDGEGYIPEERWHLWKVNVKSGSAKQLTDHQVFDEVDPCWSPDGKWIAYLSNRTSEPDLHPDSIDLFVLPSQGEEPRLLETPVGEKHLPSFSPDGRFIAYYGVEGDGLWYKNQGLWIIPADGSGKPIDLTRQYDIHVSSSTINDFGSPELMAPTWSADASRIYFPIVLHGSSLLSSISRDGTSFETVAGNDSIIGSFNFDKKNSRLCFFNGTFKDPGQIVVRSADSGVDRTLTRINQRILSKIDLGNIEETWIKGPEGNDIQGWIIRPPGFDEHKSYPSILEIHGGPLTQYGRFFMHEFYYLAANGYVVHFCNPRGGRGYGEEHAKAIWGGWGDADYRDLMAWTDYISGKSYIDPERMGVTGGSYGGYMTVWIIGHNNRFKAAVTQRCVSNLISLWGSSDVNWVFQQLLNNKPPFADLEKYWDHSPIKYIGNAKTPTLVIHSENDLRCPIEQGEQVFVALKTLGVDTEMVRFPEEFHGLSRTGRTDRRIVRLNHILRWFDKYLKNSPPVVS